MHKRTEVRRQLTVPMEIIASFADTPFLLRAQNLSPRGAFIESELMPNLGEHLVCTFNLGDSYCFFGEVSRVNLLRRASDRGVPGFGLRFMDAAPWELAAIRHALSGFPPPIPGKRREGVLVRRIITV